MDLIVATEEHADGEVVAVLCMTTNGRPAAHKSHAASLLFASGTAPLSSQAQKDVGNDRHEPPSAYDTPNSDQHGSPGTNARQQYSAQTCTS
eukprot:CAMPEP_0203869954 /NCGR_PEP_ID=MMETSP0359-20131031/17990_2 /ASSEMBLY_ACC=CAM_ASM_000338 /TAXON_ID=268821 /ORGANISM="Scrippsiella Hangoei, Strain SHTV-5" /LENGTH=91 /DNA_ID=CAMNT_0050788615 /DNA_START=234 /DNA_END=510 /DNA_ORIENTATION=-